MAEASICALRIARPNCSLLTTVDWHLRGSRQTYGVIPISAGQGRRTYKLDCGYWDRNVSITKLLYNPGGKSVMVEGVLSWRKTKIQLVNSHMPLLARGQQSPISEGGEHLPWSRFHSDQDMTLFPPAIHPT
jgi:hypothetical protein